MEPKKLKVLFVDDRTDTCEMTADLLRVGFKVDVICTEPGKDEALARLADDGASFDLVITDCDMAETLDGVRLINEIRARGMAMPIILQSANSLDLIKRSCRRLGIATEGITHFREKGGRFLDAVGRILRAEGLR